MVRRPNEAVTQTGKSDTEKSTYRPVILLVEDEMELSRVISGALKTRGLEVLSTNDGNQAISMYRSEGTHIDLVLSDVVMPSLHGSELLKSLKQIDASVKVVFMSGQPKEDALPDTPDHAFSGWLQKPFSLKDLIGTIHHALDKEPLD